MFGSEPVVGDEGPGAGAARDMSDEIAEGLGRAPVEPAAMQVKDGRVDRRLSGLAPPAGDPADAILAIANGFRGSGSDDDAIEGWPGSHAAQLTLIGSDHGAHLGHHGLVMRCTRVDRGLLDASLINFPL
jgi:hypothetical protein